MTESEKNKIKSEDEMLDMLLISKKNGSTPEELEATKEMLTNATTFATNDKPWKR